jgi:pimeloyl-ACP methyl ester carboxylesterase
MKGVPVPLSIHNPTLAYEEHGAGVPVIFLHGLTFNRSTWRPVIERVGADVRSIPVDLPGHGETPGPSLRLSEIVADVHSLCTHLGVERPVLVGHSMSGALAAFYAASYPVRGFVSIDSFPDLRPFVALVRQLEPVLRGPAFEQAFAPFQQSLGLDRIPEPLRSEVLASQAIRQDLVLGYWEELLGAPVDELQAGIEQKLARISAPGLMVFGHELSDAERAYLAWHLPQAAVEEWTEGGHCLHLVDPDRFAARLRAFIDGCG